MRDFIPAFEDTSETVRGVTTGSGFDTSVLVNRVRNVDLKRNARGIITAQARQGLTREGSLSSDDGTGSRGRGIAYFSTDTIRVDEDTYYYDGGTTTITGGNGFYDEYLASFIYATVSGAVNLILINAGHTSTNASANHGNVWYAPDGTSAATRITDANMPGNNGTSITRGGAILNGYLFLCDINGKIYNSDLNDITTWTGDFVTAEREADYGIYLGKHHNHLVYIGTRSIEFFYVTENASGSPLARRQDISYRTGCSLPNTVVEIGDVIYFAGQGDDGETHVFKLENFSLAQISNPAVDRFFRALVINFDDIASLEPTQPKYTLAYYRSPMAGPMLSLCISTQVSFVYNINLGVWHSMEVTDRPNGWGGIHGSLLGIWPIVYSDYPRNIYVMLGNGAVCSIDDADNSALDDFAAGPQNFTEPAIYSIPWDGGTNRKKRITSIRVLHDPLQDDDLDPVNFYLSWEKGDFLDSGGLLVNDASQWTNTRTLDLSTTTNNVVYRVGTGRLWVFKMEFGDTGLGVIKGLEIEYEVVGE